MVFNMIYLLYTVWYSPSKLKLTNYLNAALMMGMITVEIVLFVYSISDKNADYQNFISVVLLGLMGTMVFMVLLWASYRLVLWIRKDLMGIVVV